MEAAGSAVTVVAVKFTKFIGPYSTNKTTATTNSVMAPTNCLFSIKLESVSRTLSAKVKFIGV